MDDVLHIPPSGDQLEDLARFCDHQAAASQMTIDAMERFTAGGPEAAAKRKESQLYAAGRRDAYNQMAGVIREAKDG